MFQNGRVSAKACKLRVVTVAMVLPKVEGGAALKENEKPEEEQHCKKVNPYGTLSR